MKISKIQTHRLVGVPMEPPPFRQTPNATDALVVEVATDEGISGWSLASAVTQSARSLAGDTDAQDRGERSFGYASGLNGAFIDGYLSSYLLGMDPVATEAIRLGIRKTFRERDIGALLTSAISTIDIALWDIKGKVFGVPVHRLLGGARDRVPVYITHGAAYGSDPRYTTEELVEEAVELVRQGNRSLKNVVGRQAIPDPDDDYRRMKAIREAVGPDISLSMDGVMRMSLSQALRLCKLCEELNIAFIEEPVYQSDPILLAELRRQTIVPIAAPPNPRVSARTLLVSGSVDILHPNVMHHEGYSGALGISEMAAAFDIPIGHGNGSGPHNIAFQAGVRNGREIEYHYHRWKAYEAIFKNVPPPVDGYLTVSQQPGLDLEPREGLIEEYGVTRS